jgi:ABC-type multidrug transport system fused ATPase/permease subunit
MWVSNRWLCLRTEFLSALVVFCAGLSIIFFKSINAGWAALMIVYAINLTDALLFSVRLHADMEMSMNSVERVQEYCMIEPEAPSIIEGNRPADEWPMKGSIDVKNLSLRYSESLPDVLKNVSFSVNPGEKVAVVGRTGMLH